MTTTVRIEWSARCVECPWTWEGDDADSKASSHTRNTKHGTVTTMVRQEPANVGVHIRERTMEHAAPTTLSEHIEHDAQPDTTGRGYAPRPSEADGRLPGSLSSPPSDPTPIERANGG